VSTRVQRILVVDDDPNLLRMLRRGLSLAGYDVRAAEDGEAAMLMLFEEEPDLLLLDVMLPEPLDGLELARRLRQGGSDVPILMLTARDKTVDKLEGFRVGADDYLSKPFEFEELLARIGALLRRRTPTRSEEERLSYADLVLDPATREAWRAGHKLDLTAREFDLLAFFVRHPRQVLSRQQLFRGVWGSDYIGSSNIIDANVSYLRDKLEAGGRPRLLQTVRGVGYALREAE
jgi:two-component system, OmpR family, response regulator MprA